MLQKLIFSFFIILFSTIACAKSKNDTTLNEDENKIRTIAQELAEIRFNETLKDSLNKQLIDIFAESLKKEASFNFAYDSIKPITKVESEDKKLRIFTWNTVNNIGKYTQYGFIQYYSKSKDKVLVYELIDKSDEQKEPNTISLSTDKWYGAIYYKVIENKYQETTLYTLLGWDGNNLHTNKKIIETLTFTESGRPKFGKSVFLFGRKKYKRVIFEYSQMTTMMLNYDDRKEIIVTDHLSPKSEIHTGNFEQYGPDLSYDALEYKKNYWIYIPNIDFKKDKEKKQSAIKKRKK